MKINIIVKALIVKGILCIPFVAFAWNVSEKADSHPKIIQPITSNLENRDEVQEPEKYKGFRQSSKTSDTETGGALFEKKLTKLSLEERISGDYRRALELLANQEAHQAETLLINNLHQLPSHHPSRIELATHYLKNHQHDDAELILHEGLRFDESHPEYLRLMAVICDRKEEPEKALSLLMKVKDSQRQDDNYISFLGHIYQELGSYSLARQQYFKLLQRDPQNSLWLLGVSIALDSEGQRDAALEGYRRLNQEGNFEPDVRQYIKDRIQSLKG